MPFTFSHPALVLPLLYVRKHQRWVSATGLLLGSIAPDFEKFFRMELVNEYSHSSLSILYFSCPVALGLAFVFHQVVRRPLLAHLPQALRGRLWPFAAFNWPVHFRAYYPTVLLCIIVGAGSHLLWDSFTHFNGRLVRAYPEMRSEVGPAPEAISWYEVVSWLSSILGALTLGWAVWRMPYTPEPEPADPSRPAYWWLVAGFSTVLMAVRLCIGTPQFWDVSIALIASFLGGVVLASWWAGRWLVTDVHPGSTAK
jgi:hypothetical protein